MRLFRFLGTLLLRAKERLPKNGDWIYVTESPPLEPQIDVAKPYESPEAVLARLSESAATDAVKIVYERAKSYEGAIESVSSRVYDKSKVIFGAASFASTILLALGSTLLPPLLASTWWLIALGVALSVLIIVHLSRSLIIAAKVMIREEAVLESPEEIIDLGAKREAEILRVVAARTLAYSIQTHTLVRERLNQLIIAQNSFRYALAFFIFLTLLSSLVRLAGDAQKPRVVDVVQNLGSLQKGLEVIRSDQGRLKAALSQLEREQVLIRRELRGSGDLRKAELDLLRALEGELKEIQANRQSSTTSATGRNP